MKNRPTRAPAAQRPLFCALFAVLAGATACDDEYAVGDKRRPDGGVVPVRQECRTLVIDQAHGQRYSNPENFTSAHGWGQTMSLVGGRGFRWRINRDAITEPPSSEAWVIAEPTEAFSAAEVAALGRFVRGGGALLLTTDFNVEFMNPVAAEFGVTFDGDPGSTGWARITDFVGTHPVIEGVTNLSWPLGSTVTVTTPDLTTLARFDGRTAIAAGQVGQGRLLLVAENEAFARAGLEGVDDMSGDAPRSNEQFLWNVVRWMAGCEPIQ